MTPLAFLRAVRYLQQAIDCCDNSVDFLSRAGGSVPLYLSNVNAIKLVVGEISSDPALLVRTLDNQIEGDVITPLASIQGVDLNTVALHNLFTVPVGKTLVCLGLICRFTQAVTPHNDGTFALVRLSDSGNVFNQSPTMQPVVGDCLEIGFGFSSPTLVVAAGDTVAVSIGLEDTGSDCVGTFDLIGYLV